MSASLVREANYIGPSDGNLRVEVLAAATSEVIDLADATRGNILGGYITMICDAAFGFRFSDVNTGTANLAATDAATPADRVGLVPANTLVRFRVPSFTGSVRTIRYMVVISTAGGTLRMWRSDEA